MKVSFNYTQYDVQTVDFKWTSLRYIKDYNLKRAKGI
jgi:hypothetical protein